ncbi:hypothetical protein M0R45_024860 [Rubus argutus]|uniref:Uncharacterized protein n=1 Tax=Rubus argutus TaxID=59490 RepID=A0AAW1WVJ3_RUBAR
MLGAWRFTAADWERRLGSLGDVAGDRWCWREGWRDRWVGGCCGCRKKNAGERLLAWAVMQQLWIEHGLEVEATPGLLSGEVWVGCWSN